MHSRPLSFFFFNSPHICLYHFIFVYYFTKNQKTIPKKKREREREREREKKMYLHAYVCVYACVLKNELGPSNLRKSLCLLLCYWYKPRQCIFPNPNPTSKEKWNILGIILYTWSLEHRFTSIYAFFFSMNCLIINHFL